MDDVAIKVDGLGKVFKLPHERAGSIKSAVVNFYRRDRTYEMQEALDDVSFEVKKGEFFGIVGRNGSGKSTLLKLMAGIYVPTKGEIKINGSLTPFIELGVGFNPELTGRENVFLNGALLGFNRKQMNSMYGEIVEFAELKKFMDQELKNYSSGMQVRLAFSIAIRARSDILLLDEVLAVGDSAFQQKSLDYFVKRKKEKRTTVLVTHNMQTIEQFCDRVVLIDGGKLQKIGDSSEVASMYEEMFLREEAQKIRKDRDKRSEGEHERSNQIKILSLRTFQDGEAATDIIAGKDFEIKLSLKSKEKIDIANVGINIKNHDKIMLIATDTINSIGNISLLKNTEKNISFNIQNILTDGVYIINVGVADNSGVVPKLLLRQDKSQEFIVKGVKSNVKALTHPDIVAKEE